jgi:uncharacterized protein involved in outer membrane biogenesis
MKMMQRIRAMSRWQKFITAVLACLLVFTIIGFLILPPILKSVLQKKLSENLHREALIEDIDVNPYALSCLVEGLVIKAREGLDTFVSFDKLYINVEIMSLFKWALITKEIRLEQPYLNLVREEETRYNFSDLLQKSQEGDSQEEASEPSEPARFALNNIQIINGSVDIWDKPKNKKHKMTDINIQIPTVSNQPHSVDIFVQPFFEARLNDTLVSLKGKSKPFHDSLETVFDVDLRDINVPYYLAYIPMEQKFKVLSGLLDVKLALSYIQPPDGPPAFSVSGDVILKTTEVVDGQDNPMLKLPRLLISIAPTEIFAKKPHIAKISVESPEVNVLRDKAGNTNIQSMLPEKKTEESAPETDANEAPMSVNIDEIQLSAGKVFFSDVSGTEPFETTLEPIDVSMSHFSTDKEKKTAFQMSLKTEVDEKISVTGEFSLDPMVADSTLELQGVHLKKYAPYYMESVTFDVEEGSLNFQTRYQYEKKGNDFALLLSDLSTTMSSLVLKKRGEREPFAKVPLFAVKDTEVDLAKRVLTIGEVAAEKGVVNCVVYKNGDLNLATLAAPSAESTPTEAPEEAMPWQVTLGKIMVEDCTVNAEDLTPSEPVKLTVDKMKLGAQGISTVEKSRGNLDLSCRLNKRGTISIKGSVGINPVFADVKATVKDIGIGSLQSYFTDQVKIVVTDGSFSTSGSLSLSSSKDGDISARYRGQVALSDLATVDKLHAEDLLKWKSLRLNEIDLGYNPTVINVEEVALDGLFTRLIVAPDGKLNLQTIVAEGADKEVLPSEVEKETAPSEENADLLQSVRIDKVTITRGHINFTDKSVDPSYATDLVEIEGSVSGLSSDETKLADVHLSGKLDNYAPLDITGKINPLIDDLYADLKIDFRNMDLSPMTPYAGKYVGYTLQKGKLSLGLKYLIDQGKLNSQNKVFLDQLTFGNKVESPDAPNLPVKLGVALLKNRKGEIDLDLPVSGDLDDPEFRVGKIIVKMIMNLLVKAATSPFSLLGAMFGGGEELSALEFDYGRFEITAESEKKLDTLTQALYDRPALKLDIEGHVDIEQDREGLRQYLFDKQLKAEKLKDIVKKEAPTISVDEITIEPEEYEEYLWKAYKEAEFKKPKNIVGLTKKLPVPEMEQLLLEHTDVEEDDLRLLAVQRAQRVKDHILQSGKVETERIFLIEPQSLEPERKEALKDSRVDLRLK